MNKLLLLLVTAILLTTAVCQVVFADTPPVSPPASGVQPHGNLGGRIARELNLTDNQKALLKPILQAARQQFKAIRTDSTLTPDQKKQKLTALKAQVRAEVNQVLTPAQQAECQTLRAQFHKNHPGGWQHNGP